MLLETLLLLCLQKLNKEKLMSTLPTYFRKPRVVGIHPTNKGWVVKRSPRQNPQLIVSCRGLLDKIFEAETEMGLEEFRKVTGYNSTDFAVYLESDKKEITNTKSEPVKTEEEAAIDHEVDSDKSEEEQPAKESEPDKVEEEPAVKNEKPKTKGRPKKQAAKVEETVKE